MKKLCATLLCLALCMGVLPVRAAGPEVNARAALLMEKSTGQVLYEANAHAPLELASVTKVMTMLLIMEALDAGTITKETMVPVSATAAGMGGSQVYMEEGEEFSVHDMLKAIAVASGNDACVAMAEYLAGSESAFVEKMNARAAELGMEDTSFENPSGLDGQAHYSTARDMARLAAYAAGNHTFVRLCSTRSVTIGGRTMTNHNRLLRAVPGCIGMKTGYTRAAGRTLVSAAERDGRRLVAVTLQDGNDWADHAALYDWGFAQETRQATAALNQEDTP